MSLLASMSRSRSSLRFPALEILYVAVLRNVVSHIPSERQIILKINMMFRLAEEWVVPEKIHTPPTEEISAVRRGRGDKIVSDNNKCIRTLTSNFLRGGGMDVFWNDPMEE